MEDLLKIKNAAFYYESGKFLFRGLNFSVKRGEILSILGLNGQGKSTLMFCMMGVFALKEGEISGEAKFAFLPQSFNVAFDYSVLDIVLMGRIREISIFSKPSSQKRVSTRFQAVKDSSCSLLERWLATAMCYF